MVMAITRGERDASETKACETSGSSGIESPAAACESLGEWVHLDIALRNAAPSESEGITGKLDAASEQTDI